MVHSFTCKPASPQLTPHLLHCGALTPWAIVLLPYCPRARRPASAACHSPRKSTRLASAHLLILLPPFLPVETKTESPARCSPLLWPLIGPSASPCVWICEGGALASGDPGVTNYLLHGGCPLILLASPYLKNKTCTASPLIHCFPSCGFSYLESTRVILMKILTFVLTLPRQDHSHVAFISILL